MKRRKVFELLTLCAMFMAVSPMGVLAGDMRLTGQGKEVTGEAEFQDYRQEYPLGVPQEAVIFSEKLYDTGLCGVTMSGSGVLNYEVEHIGTGSGVMECMGHATGDYEVVVKIIKSGVIGEAQFQISLDGGESYIGQDVVADSSKVVYAGLTLFFQTDRDTTEFVEGDEYRVSVPETFPVTASKTCAANVIVKGHPLEDHDLTVTILSSGGLGNSRFTVASTKGTEISITDVIPESGVYEIDDGLSLVFSDSDAYEKGLTYTATVKSNDDSVNDLPLYIMAGMIVANIAGLFAVLSAKKEKDSEYHIRKYSWEKDEKDYE